MGVRPDPYSSSPPTGSSPSTLPLRKPIVFSETHVIILPYCPETNTSRQMVHILALLCAASHTCQEMLRSQCHDHKVAVDPGVCCIPVGAGLGPPPILHIP